MSKVEKGGGEGLYSAKRETKWLRGSLIECEREDADDPTDWKNNPDKKKAKKYYYRYCQQLTLVLVEVKVV